MAKKKKKKKEYEKEDKTVERNKRTVRNMECHEEGKLSFILTCTTFYLTQEGVVESWGSRGGGGGVVKRNVIHVCLVYKYAIRRVLIISP
jgi:hypothetical protein